MTSCIRLAVIGAFAILAPVLWAVPGTAQQEHDPRLALVIGESAYQQDPLATAANDAGLVANTLSEAGFEVIGARDLDQDALRRSLREFLDKAAAAGPNAIVFVYFAGYGLQLEGENFLVPVGARITRDTEVPIEALRLSDFSRSLAAIPLKARILVLDAAHASPFGKSGPPLASGLALMDPDTGTLIAFNAAPGTVAPPETGSYGVYAQSFTEMMRDGGLPLGDVFARTRLRVTEKTNGAVVPWEADKIEQPFTFFNRAPDAPPAVSTEQTAALRDRSIREMPPEEAYGIAVERDTIPAYEEFLAAFPNSPLSKRVRAMLAARREAVTWRRTVSANAPNAYWSYLKRYPNGPHASDARRRLTRLTAPLVPPPVFEAFDYDIPPPPPEEYVIVDRPVLVFDEPDFGPPPLVPVYLLPPPPDDWVALPPPPPAPAPFYLPIPIPIPIPVWSRPPRPPITPPPIISQPGTGRPLPPPTVPVGAGFIQPPQAIITRPPTATRPAALPGQSGATAPQLPTTQVPTPPVPANPVPANPVPTNPVPTTKVPTTAVLPTTAPAVGAVPSQNVKPGQLQPLKPRQNQQPVKPGQNATQPNPLTNPLPGTQPLPTPGANGLPAAGGTAPPTKLERGRKPGSPGRPVDQNAVTQPQSGPGAGVNGQPPSKAAVGVGSPTSQQLRQQRLLQQKQQIDEQNGQQQQTRQPRLQQQQLQQQQQKVQQNLQQKNLQLQQQRQPLLEEKNSQQQQQHQQQIQQQQMQRLEMQRQQQSQQQQIRQQQMQQQRAQQQQLQPQRAQRQIGVQQQAPRPNCGQPGLPPCPH